MPIEITAARQGPGKAAAPGKPVRMRRRRGKAGVRERMFFTEQLSLLLETGTPLHAALKALGRQVENREMAEIIAGLQEHVTGGKPFSWALAQYPVLFPGTYVKLVAAAEDGGFLDTVLLELLRMDEKREQLRNTVVSALTYPAFLIVFSLFVVVFVLVVVFPKFATLFASIADKLPATTIVLMHASHVLVEYWPLLLLAVAAIAGGSAWWLRTPGGSATLDRLKLRVAGLRSIFIQIYLVQSMRVLGLSLANGVSVPDALVSCREVVSNRVFRKFLLTIEERVKEGGGFAAAFQQEEFIPPLVRQMVSTGEETGSLPRVLGRVADYYERELQKQLAAFSRMVEPVMLIVMGAVVGLIVSSLILPIFKLSQAVH
ncbi:MAG: type II secretion system F family protein [Pseudomonadota bacterium]